MVTVRTGIMWSKRAILIMIPFLVMSLLMLLYVEMVLKKQIRIVIGNDMSETTRELPGPAVREHTAAHAPYFISEPEDHTAHDNTNGSSHIRAPPVTSTHSTRDTCVKRLPQAIIGGIGKSGTKALITFLNRHPQIVACLQPGEVHYFDNNYDKPLSWYRDLMPCSYQGQITIEKTPNYNNRDNWPDRIKEMNPAVKIILIYKEPIYRAHSEFLMDKAAGKVTAERTFAESVIDTEGKVNSDIKCMKVSAYSRRVKNWRRVFPADQVFFVDGQKMETDPVSELRQIEAFLNIPHVLTQDMFVYNATKGKYCLAETEGAMSCLSGKKGRHHPDLDTGLVRTLQEYFKPRNEEFFTLTGRRFDWGY